jgi:hypothetical protein
MNQGVQLFLKELEQDKYSVCCGAFREVSLSSTIRRINGFIMVIPEGFPLTRR